MKTFSVSAVMIDGVSKDIARFYLCPVYLFYDLEEQLGILPAVGHEDQFINRTGENEQIFSERCSDAGVAIYTKSTFLSSSMFFIESYAFL